MYGDRRRRCGGVGWGWSTFFSFFFLTQSRSSVRQSQWGTKLTRRFYRVALQLKPTAITGLRSPLAEGNCALCRAPSSQLGPLRRAVRDLKENAEREKPGKVKSHSRTRRYSVKQRSRSTLYHSVCMVGRRVIRLLFSLAVASQRVFIDRIVPPV